MDSDSYALLEVLLVFGFPMYDGFGKGFNCPSKAPDGLNVFKSGPILSQRHILSYSCVQFIELYRERA